MKTPFRHVHALLLLLTFSAVNHPFSTAFAQGTAFTYQGRLNSDGGPAGGTYDLAFTLYNTNTTGVAVAGPVTNSATVVSNGLFTTAVDFRPGVFTGASNWLEIAVSTNGANSFTKLAPRQQLTPTPYALYAPNAGNAGSVAAANISGSLTTVQLPASVLTNGARGVNLSGTFSGNASGLTDVAKLSGGNMFNGNQIVANGYASIGLVVPDRPLAIEGVGVSGEWISLMDSSGTTKWHVNNNLGGLNFVQSGVADFRLFISTNGNVGIGNSTPASPLTVSGNIQMGNGGASYAASGTENLRIVRGIVSATGGIIKGSGFSVSSNGIGVFTITFTPSFADVPAITLSGASCIATWNTLTPSYAITSIVNYGGAPINQVFTFIAVGPP
jgi:hypothetical protein